MSAFELDLGVLSHAERTLLSPRHEVERIEGFLFDALYRAGLCRRRLPRIMRGTPEYAAENYRRHHAIEQAQRHIARLRALGAEVPSDLLYMASVEGVSA